MTVRSLHGRAALDDGLATLQSQLRQLASLVDVAIERSTLALITLDQRLAQLVISGDAEVNALRFQIEDRAIHLIATQQPIAGDLRFVVAVLMLVSELERMGDYAAGNARIVQLHAGRLHDALNVAPAGRPHGVCACCPWRVCGGPWPRARARAWPSFPAAGRAAPRCASAHRAQATAGAAAG